MAVGAGPFVDLFTVGRGRVLREHGAGYRDDNGEETGKDPHSVLSLGRMTDEIIAEFGEVVWLAFVFLSFPGTVY